MLATVVDTKALWETVVGAFIAGVGTTVVFSFAILGMSRFSAANREGRAIKAAVFGVIAVSGVLTTAAAIVIGVIVMAK